MRKFNFPLVVLIGLTIVPLLGCNHLSSRQELSHFPENRCRTIENGWQVVPSSGDMEAEMMNDQYDIIKKNAKLYSSSLCVDQEGEESDMSDTPSSFAILKEHIDVCKYEELVQLGKEELLAHAWVYNGHLSGASVVRFVDGVSYDVSPIRVDHKGIHAFILTSQNLMDPHIRVVFRGTKCIDSACRNMECISYGGAGIASYATNKNLILNQIRTRLSHYQDKCSRHNPNASVTLTISGHSLGGADAQNTVHAILEEIAEQKGKNSHFSFLKAMHLYLFNSTGVAQNVVDSCNRYVKEIDRYGVRFPIHAYNVLVDGDAVQCTGEGHIFDKVGPKIVQSKLYKFKRDVLGLNHWITKARNLSRAHRKKFFVDETAQKEDECEVQSNSTSKGAKRITEELTTKFEFLKRISQKISHFWGSKSRERD